MAQGSLNREFWLRFLESYKRETCLWQVKSKPYMNKDRKLKSYGKLLEYLKTGIPDADIAVVKAKINVFRTNFRKELRKIHLSKQSGHVGEDVYTPTLWYFKPLLFLNDAENVDEANTSTTSYNENENGDTFEEPEPKQPEPFCHETFIKTEEDDSEIDPSRSCTPVWHMNKKMKTTDDLNVAKDPNEDTLESEECDLVGRTWARKLYRLPEHVRPHVEKQINDIFFNAITSMMHYTPEYLSPASNRP